MRVLTVFCFLGITKIVPNNGLCSFIFVGKPFAPYSAECIGPCLECDMERLGINSTLFELQMKNENMGNLSSDFFNGMRIHTLHIHHCKLDSLSGGRNGPALIGLESTLENLTIGYSFSEVNIPARLNISHLTKLKYLTLEYNNITELSDDWFKDGPDSLERLLLRENRIEKLGYRAFDRLKNLEVLLLDGNRLGQVYRSFLPFYATRLYIISLGEISLREIPEDFFHGMPALKFVWLRDIEISRLDRITWEPVWEKLEEVALYANPLECDFHMEWMLEFKPPENLYGHCINILDQFNKSMDLKKFINNIFTSRENTSVSLFPNTTVSTTPEPNTTRTLKPTSTTRRKQTTTMTLEPTATTTAEPTSTTTPEQTTITLDSTTTTILKLTTTPKPITKNPESSATTLKHTTLEQTLAKIPSTTSSVPATIITTESTLNMTTRTTTTPKPLTKTTQKPNDVAPFPVPSNPPPTDCHEKYVDCIFGKTRDVIALFHCPTRYGCYPHASSKQLYIQCDHFRPFIKKCLGNTEFSPQILLCVCTTLEPTTKTTQKLNTIPPFSVPNIPPSMDCYEKFLDCLFYETRYVIAQFECPTRYGCYPYSSSKQLFIHCDDFRPFIKTCAENTEFFPQFHLCECRTTKPTTNTSWIYTL